jgi:hypothetical protein
MSAAFSRSSALAVPLRQPSAIERVMGSGKMSSSPHAAYLEMMAGRRPGWPEPARGGAQPGPFGNPLFVEGPPARRG